MPVASRSGEAGAPPWQWRGAASIFEQVEVYKCAANGWWSAGRGYRLVRWRLADCETGVSAGGLPLLLMSDSLLVGSTDNVGSSHGVSSGRGHPQSSSHPMTGFRFYDRAGPQVRHADTA